MRSFSIKKNTVLRAKRKKGSFFITQRTNIAASPTKKQQKTNEQCSDQTCVTTI